MSVPLQDPAREYRALRDRIDEALLSVAASGSYVLGPEGEAFEEELARYLGVDHTVGVGSGTDALVLALRAVGVGPGDEVVVPPFTFFATAEAVLRAGADPVFADIRPGTFCLDPAAAEEAVTDRTAALVPVHVFGQMADTEALAEVADRHDLALVEDAAQALGAARRTGGSSDVGGPERAGRGAGDPGAGAGGRDGGGGASDGSAATSDGDPADSDASASAGRWVRAGAAGDVGCFSFYPTKNLAALGDAGAVATDDPDTAARLRSLRDHGRGPEGGGRHAEPAWNTRLDELQAAVLRAKLEVLDEWNGRRRRHARAYDRAFDGLDGVEPPPVAPGNRHVYHQYTVRCRDRDAVAEALSERDVGHGVYYPVPLHRQPALAGRIGGRSGGAPHGAGDASGRPGTDAPDGDGGAGDTDAEDGGVAAGGGRPDRAGDRGAEGAPTGPSFPEAERAAREVLSLPVFPLLEDGERERVIEAVRDAAG